MSDELSGQNNIDPGEGNQGTFLDGFSNEDLKGNEMLKPYVEDGGIEKLAADFVELKGKQPQIPENADGYALELEGMPEQYVSSVNEFKPVAHELGLTQSQLEGVLKFDKERTDKIQMEMEKKRDDAIKANKDEMGDKYEENVSLAQKVLKAFKGEGLLKESIEESGELLGNNAEFFKFLVNVAASISEDKLELGGSGPADTVKRDAAGNPQFTYTDMAASS